MTPPNWGGGSWGGAMHTRCVIVATDAIRQTVFCAQSFASYNNHCLVGRTVFCATEVRIVLYKLSIISFMPLPYPQVYSHSLHFDYCFLTLKFLKNTVSMT